MVKAIFADAIVKNLCIYFERKVMPIPEAIDMWFRRCEKIPDESVEWIVKRIKDNCEGFPKNLPNMLWEHYREWLSSHPEKQALPRGELCKKCNGFGYIFGFSFMEGRHYEYVFRCPACQQAPESGIPIWNHQHAADYHALADQMKPPTHETIKAMVASIGKPITDVTQRVLI
jgi:hypothetical protein